MDRILMKIKAARLAVSTSVIQATPIRVRFAKPLPDELFRHFIWHGAEPYNEYGLSGFFVRVNPDEKYCHFYGYEGSRKNRLFMSVTPSEFLIVLFPETKLGTVGRLVRKFREHLSADLEVSVGDEKVDL